MSTLGKNNSDGRGKTKPVEFSEGIKSLSKRAKSKRLMGERENERAKLKEDESDLTDLDELEASLQKASSRRPRGRSRCIQADEFGAIQPRRLPMRKAKGRMKGLKEEDEGLDVREEDGLSDEGINEDIVEEEEVDELISSTPTPSPSRGRRTPLRTRLRPRRRPVPPSSDGDDEGSNVEEAAEETEEDDVESIEGSEDGGGVDETIALEPRKLRNGKIVVDVHMEEDNEEEGEEAEEECEEAEQEGEEEGTEDGADGGDEEEEDQSDECTEVGDVDIDADGETDEDEVMDENDGELLCPREICTYLYLTSMTSGLDSGNGQNSC